MKNYWVHCLPLHSFSLYVSLDARVHCLPLHSFFTYVSLGEKPSVHCLPLHSVSMYVSLGEKLFGSIVYLSIHSFCMCL